MDRDITSHYPLNVLDNNITFKLLGALQKKTDYGQNSNVQPKKHTKQHKKAHLSDGIHNPMSLQTWYKN